MDRPTPKPIAKPDNSFQAALQRLWERRGDDILEQVAMKHPELIVQLLADQDKD